MNGIAQFDLYTGILLMFYVFYAKSFFNDRCEKIIKMGDSQASIKI